MTEREHLMPIVVKWFDSMGYCSILECLLGGYCDVVGCKYSERVGRKKPKLLDAIAVELKIRDVSGVLSQAIGNLNHVNYSYAAMPIEFCLRMREKNLMRFRDSGIGLLGIDVDNHNVEVILTPLKNPSIDEIDTYIANRLWANKLRNKDKMAKLLERIKLVSK